VRKGEIARASGLDSKESERLDHDAHSCSFVSFSPGKILLAPDCCQAKRGKLRFDDPENPTVIETAGVTERINSGSKLRTY
jgi:hypothetical protein